MSNISTWSTTAASNNAATPDGFPEGQSPSSLNDCGRTLMAAIRTQHESAQWIDYGHTPTKVDSDTFTVSGDQTSIYDAGRRIKFTGSVSGYATISSSSYSAPNTTVNVSAASWTGTLTSVAVGIISGTNRAIATGSGSGLDADTLDGVDGSGYATYSSGSFTGTLTGMTGSVTGTIYYKIVGGICTLYNLSAAITGTSNSGAMTMTGLPAAVQPTRDVAYVPCTVRDLNLPVLGSASISSSSSTISFAVGTITGFQTSSTKGLGAGWHMSYPLS